LVRWRQEIGVVSSHSQGDHRDRECEMPTDYEQSKQSVHLAPSKTRLKSSAVSADLQSAFADTPRLREASSGPDD
jgi:hypothetical protein